jgi:hypothetical protein
VCVTRTPNDFEDGFSGMTRRLDSDFTASSPAKRPGIPGETRPEADRLGRQIDDVFHPTVPDRPICARSDGAGPGLLSGHSAWADPLTARRWSPFPVLSFVCSYPEPDGT